MHTDSVTAYVCHCVVQRGDIALAITKCDMFDFLIDIVPREEILFKINRKQGANPNPKVVFYACVFTYVLVCVFVCVCTCVCMNECMAYV